MCKLQDAARESDKYGALHALQWTLACPARSRHPVVDHILVPDVAYARPHSAESGAEVV